MAKTRTRGGDKVNDQDPTENVLPFRGLPNPLTQTQTSRKRPNQHLSEMDRLRQELGEAIETLHSMERQHETVLQVLATHDKTMKEIRAVTVANEKTLKEIAAALGVPSKRISVRRSIAPAREPLKPLKDKDIQVPGGVYLTEKVLPGNKRVEIMVTVVGSSVDDGTGTVVYETYSKEKKPRLFKRPAHLLFDVPKDWMPDEDSGDEGGE